MDNQQRIQLNDLSDYTSNEVEDFSDSDYSYNADDYKSLVSIDEYRQDTNDYQSSNNQVKEKLLFLEAFCRNIARNELLRLHKNE